MESACTIQMDDGSVCGRDVTHRGLCRPHYNRQRRGAPMGNPIQMRQKHGAIECVEDGCTRKPHARGFCGPCYQRKRQTIPGWVAGLSGDQECTVDRCEKLVQADGLCNMHNVRKRMDGDVGGSRAKRIHGTAAERFWPKVDRSGECWLWTGGLDSSGYGNFRGPQPKAHRMAYVLEVGPIPEGMAIHHTCGTTTCVNPAHLIPVTARENTIESLRCKALEAENARLVAENDQLQAELTAIKLGASVYAV